MREEKSRHHRSWLWLDRLRVVLRNLRYREAWTFRPRQSLGLLKYLMCTRPTWRDGTAELNAYSPPVGGGGYARYLQGLRRMGRGEWVPLLAHVSVTDRCPYRCPRCSNVAQGGCDPPLDKLARLFEELRAAGTARIALTGGEPLVREDLEAILAACGPDLSPLLFTSGYGLDTARAQRLRAAGLTAAFISLDDFRAEQHDHIRGQAGAFDQAVAAIRASRAAGLYTAAQAVVEPPLLAPGAVDEYLAFSRQLGVDEVMLLEPVPVVGTGPGLRSGLDSDARQRLAELHLRAARDSAWPKVSSMSWLESPNCLGCQAGLSFLYVTAQGEVFPCDFAPLSFGNVFELGVREVCRRLVQVLRHPSCDCLALRFRKQYGERPVVPLSWRQTQDLMSGYDPGPLPALMRDLSEP